MKKILFLIVALSATLNMNAQRPRLTASLGAVVPVVKGADPTAKDWCDKLGQAISTVSAYKSTLDPKKAADLIKTIDAALTAARGVYKQGYDESTSLDTYKNAYETLWSAYQGWINADILSLVDNLEQEINKATTTNENTITFDYNQKKLGSFIDAANAKKNEYRSKLEGSDLINSDIKVLNDAITALQKNLKDVVNADITDATDSLKQSITKAEKQMTSIAKESSVIAGSLNGKIEIAKTSLSKKTAKELRAAAWGLDVDVQVEKNNLTEFNKSKSELYSNAKAAEDVYTGIKATHEKIRSVLYEAIGTALGVYGNAIDMTINELDKAKSDVEFTKSEAENSNEVANEIDAYVGNATVVLNTITDLAIKEKISNAIEAAKKVVKEKNALPDLNNALEALKAATEDYIDVKFAQERAALNMQLYQAEYNYTYVLAYQEHIDELKKYYADAKNKYDSSENYTIDDIITATTTLKAAIETIVAKDGQKAEDALNAILPVAKLKLAEVNEINTTLAGDVKLDTEIKNAEKYVANGDAKTRKLCVEALNAAIASADAAVVMFRTNEKNLAQAIQDAEETLSSKITEGHTGIQTALSDAIKSAKGVQEKIQSTKNNAIKNASTDLNSKKIDAESAEVYAKGLDEQINIAETAQGTIIDPIEKERLGEAIANAKNMLLDKKKTALDYQIGYNTLKMAIDLYIQNDIAIAKANLSDAITYADNARNNVVVIERYKDTIKLAITNADKVFDDSKATAAKVVAATETLRDVVDKSIKSDLDEERVLLNTAIGNAKTALDEYSKIGDAIKNKKAKEDYDKKVTSEFSKAITAAETTSKKDESTSKQMETQINNLANKKAPMVSAYETACTNEKPNLAAALNAENNKVAEIKAENNVIADEKHTPMLKEGNRVNDIIFGVDPTGCTYAEIINARIGMEEECKALDTEFTSWKSYANALYKMYKEDGTVDQTIAALQDVHKGEGSEIVIKLTDAKAKAKEVGTSRKNKSAKDLEDAIDTLQKVIDAAVHEDTYWDFTDAKPEFKEGTYFTDHAIYTRSGAAIATGNYGTFCLPMDIKVTYEGEKPLFKNVYTPETFSILHGTTLKLFLIKVEEGSTIKAGTPFFAQLNCDEELSLVSSKALKVSNGKLYYPAETEEGSDQAVKVSSKTIKVYVQDDPNSSFVTYDKDITFTWSGTFAKTDNIDNKFVFNTNGNFAKATGAINPFRAYLQQKVTTPSNGKSVEAIEFDFGNGSETTGINSIMVGSSDGSQIFSIDGKKMGNDMNSLNKGVYIINGKKVLK